MKFTTTENTVYRAGIGTIPKAWIEYTFKRYEEYGDVYQTEVALSSVKHDKSKI